VTLIDFRGHGLSERGSGPITITQLGRDVQRCLDVLGIGQAVFAGCSLGGYVLYEIWRRMPQRVNALAFCCGKPQPDSPSGRDKRLETIKDVERNGTGPFFDRGLASLSAASFLRQQPDRAAELREMMDAVSAETVVAIQLCLMERPDSLPTLPTISVPVLALAASQDQASTPEEMQAITSHAPYAHFHLVEDAGHFAPFEKPTAVAKILDRFFSTYLQ
jgi:pimeloyl-ACP methyl ester carboxylesterase